MTTAMMTAPLQPLSSPDIVSIPTVELLPEVEFPAVVGIDPALVKTGIGIIERRGRSCVGRTELVSTLSLDDNQVAERYTRISYIAARVDAAIPPGTVLALLEAPALDAVYGDAWGRAGVWWHIVGHLRRRRIPVGVVMPTTLKKWATGYGGSRKRPVDKTHIVAAMREMWPGLGATASDARHHECEGLAMAHMCAQHLSWPVPVRRHHGEPLEVIQWPK